MLSSGSFGRYAFPVLLGFLCGNPTLQAASACVWKVTSSKGGTAYLGGSVHALRSTDYPLPAAFNQAFDASDRLAFEIEDNPGASSMKRIFAAGKYPKGDSLKNHVDPRTYAYLRRVFALMNVPEEKFASLRPWMLVLAMQTPELRGLSSELGVEGFLGRRALARKKPVVGLETLQEHYAVFSGLSDRQAEAVLLLSFIPEKEDSGLAADLLTAWRRGDVDTIARRTAGGFNEFPAFGDRILGARNRNWIPKIESYLASGKTYFVVAGAAHFGGSDGLLALLRTRGHRIEQL